MSKISVIGTGYVGLVSGTCLAEFGLKVTCLDVDENKIKRLKEGHIPIYESGLESMVKRNFKSGRLSFTTNYKDAVEGADVIFIAVGTPPQDDGSADLQYVVSAAKSIAENMNGYKVIVDKSTVPVGTGKLVKKTIAETLAKRGVNFEFDVVSNPEFLREGSAVADFMHPDRIVIGSTSKKAEDIMKSVYRVLYINNHPFAFTDVETAEVIKYASNAFLATKITFVNEMANLCEAVGGDVQQVARAMGLDNRVGKYFLHSGPGYGGSCFPKDTKALVQIGDNYGVDISIVRAVVESNENQKRFAAEKVISGMNGVEGKTIGILGLAFKPNTDDVREAPAETIIRMLHEKGAKLRVYDPVAMDNFKAYCVADIKDDIFFAEDEYEALDKCDALVLVTEWNQFRSLDLDQLHEIMEDKYFFDLRNIYIKEIMKENGFKYYGTGR